MDKKPKVCFVVMGFGKKMDYRRSKEIDLDLVYGEIIKKLFKESFPEYKLIRADEISGSDIIDVSMYTLLFKADLVIADITTSNENALYELGVRHALKPFSTVIMMQAYEGKSVPFDLSHNRILTYKDYGEKLDEEEANAIREELKKFVIASQESRTDSPFYTYLPNVQPPVLEEEKYQMALKEMAEKEVTIAKVKEQAEALKEQSNFEEAAGKWEKLHNMIPNNAYVTQQWALATYKSKKPSETIALQKALDIIKTLNPEKSLDLETLGITGAIYKRLANINHNFDYLNEAMKMYGKGYMIQQDYYNGENYANCLLFSTKKRDISEEEKIYLKYSSKKIYSELIDVIMLNIRSGEIDFWMYATLAVSYFNIGDQENYKKYEELFLNNATAEWEKETYLRNFEKVRECLEG